ncbi:hypothetical protein DYB32_000580 [Aphanomyces invadans]|uniref:ABC transmembrane type-1 domain-containing protein n=1 Tax=Aphanomyces invadans TaxID=157072 RepID=A0A3R6Z5S0_9STRA|nr:hypothetical protein DYB32_000580 [Aphanomyces invadans]
MAAQSKLAGGAALAVIALALAIREKGQKEAEIACTLNSQYTPEKKKGQDKKVAINKDFIHHLSRFLLVMLPVSVVNCLLKYGQTELSLRFRTRLSTYLYAKYLHEYTYYKVSNLDTRISNPDQLLTVDVERFATSVSDLYSNVTKPVLDISIYAFKLAGTIGLSGPTTMLSYLVGSGVFLTWLRQPTGRFTIAEQRLEGNYRFVNARLITHSEEIAFYHGNEREHSIVQSSYDALIQLIRQAQQFRFSVSVVDNVVAKVIVAEPRTCIMLHPNGMRSPMGRLVLSGRELTRLAGFTLRVTDMIQVLEDLHAGNYKRTMIQSSSGNTNAPGVIEYKDNVIEFENVPLMTPNGDVLVPSLSFKVLATIRQTDRSLRDQILYPDSVDKMVAAGRTDADLLALLQLVQLEYLIDGTASSTPARWVSVPLVDGWNAIKDWADVLSGGEKQRLAMARWVPRVSTACSTSVYRLFYHAPQFAILDECTSAVSVDVEGLMYAYCKSQRITLFTVSHRQSLWKYHDYVLQVPWLCLLAALTTVCASLMAKERTAFARFSRPTSHLVRSQ